MHWGHLQISQYAKSNKKIIFKKYAMNYLKENLIFNNFNIIKKKRHTNFKYFKKYILNNEVKTLIMILQIKKMFIDTYACIYQRKFCSTDMQW